MGDFSFDSIFDMMASSTSFEDSIKELTQQISTIEIVTPVIEQKVSTVSVDYFDQKNNTLLPENKEKFKQEIPFNEKDIFTDPIVTTITMEGLMTNVKFHEREFIKELAPSVDIVVIDCNYGKLIYPGYIEKIKVKNNNRGRKKKTKVKKPRKVQGSGLCFASQITFVRRALDAPLELLIGPLPEHCYNKNITPDASEPQWELIEPIYFIPSSTPVYKFKLFRPGRMQLPGARPDTIDDIIEKAHTIAEYVDSKLHVNELNVANRSRVINMNPVMKNYKFCLKTSENELINLTLLKKILLNYKTHSPLDAPVHPAYCDVKYTREDVKLSIMFITPIARDPTKTTLVSIFMRGKINILGIYHTELTKQICDYLYYIFKNNPKLIVKEHTINLINYETLAEIANDEFREFMNTLDDTTITNIKEGLIKLGLI